MVTISRSIKTSLASLFVFVLFLCSTSCGPSPNTNNANGGTVLPSSTPTPSPSPTPVDCKTATSKEIIETIYRELEPLKLGESVFDFNISAEAPPEINIVGWSAQRADILAAIARIAPDCSIPPTPVTFFDTEGQLPPDYQRLGCSGGFKPCGDVCLPPDQHCAWAGAVYRKAADSKSTSTSKPGASSNVGVNTARTNSNSNTNTAKKP